MSDQIIDATRARGLHTDACRSHNLIAWIVMHEPSEYPDKVVARLVTNAPTPYMLLADSLAELQAQLPGGLTRSDRQLADPPEVLEIWFAG